MRPIPISPYAPIPALPGSGSCLSLREKKRDEKREEPRPPRRGKCALKDWTGKEEKRRGERWNLRDTRRTAKHESVSRRCQVKQKAPGLEEINATARAFPAVGKGDGRAPQGI